MLRDFHFEQSDTAILTPVAGLTAVSRALHEMAGLSVLAAADPGLHGGASHSDILSAYVALLIQGKALFRPLPPCRAMSFLRLGKVASPERLRQRIQRYPLDYMRLVGRANQHSLNHQQITFGALDTGRAPLDIDAVPMDNSGSKKTMWSGRTRVLTATWSCRRTNEPIARLANAEDKVTGYFWQARFSSQAFLDEAAVLAATAYADVLPIRAGIAETPQASDFTSIQQRIAELKQHQRQYAGADSEPPKSPEKTANLNQTIAKLLGLSDDSGQSSENAIPSSRTD